MVQLKRAYEAPAQADGVRVLVERLWPRGVTKENLHLDSWMKDIAPSPALRTWYGHMPEKWPEFQKRYRAELAEHKALLAELRALGKNRTLTLVFAAKDETRNSAAILRDVLAGPRH
jgi:uncharacterized protein YeaO (DUF488 family)